MIKHFWKLEYSITIFVFLALLLMLVPVGFENYWQANMITRWQEKFGKIEYMFKVIDIQKKDEILKSLATTESTELREKMLFQLVKPYLRIEAPNNFPRRYKMRFKNGSKVTSRSKYYFDDIYYSENKMTIVGLKDLADYEDSQAWFMIMVDINGLLLPNTWGKDIFGIYVFDEGTIKPFGYDVSVDELERDCSKSGLGLYCSKYYLIGGVSDD